MGCQGEVYVVYGVKVDGKCEWEAAAEENPVVYSVNGHMLCDDAEGAKDEGFEHEIEFYNGVPTSGYGAADMNKAKLTLRVLGHSDWMGARHATEGFGKSVGKKCNVLVGYVVGNECYIDSASELPKGDDILRQVPRLLTEIKEKLGLDIKPAQLGAYLLFDSINGM